MEAARLLIRVGRSWLRLTLSDVERGARAVATDPVYGEEICSNARRTAEGWAHLAITHAVEDAIGRVTRGWPKQVPNDDDTQVREVL